LGYDTGDAGLVLAHPSFPDSFLSNNGTKTVGHDTGDAGLVLAHPSMH